MRLKLPILSSASQSTKVASPSSLRSPAAALCCSTLVSSPVYRRSLPTAASPRSFLLCSTHLWPKTSMSKRKRPETNQGLVPDEDRILNVIKARKDSAIWVRDIKQEVSDVPGNVVTRIINSLKSKELIKEVVNYRNKAQKHYMAIEFEPSKEISGGVWYTAGSLDTELLSTLKRLCVRCLRENKVATLEKIHSMLVKSGVLEFEISIQQVAEILNSMILDNDILEVKSTGLGDYHSIVVGKPCYRMATNSLGGKGRKMGAFAAIPCGACPRIGVCTPDGVISPRTCVYYTKWLNLDF